MAPTSDLFSRCGPPGRGKFLFLGSPDFHAENLLNCDRSLKLEHVSPVRLVRLEISRRPVSAAVAQSDRLALLRRWFFTRKPDAGFVLTDFPATLLQALVFDEWLEARDEALHAVVAGPSSDESVVIHYRTLGLLVGVDEFAA